MADVLYTITEAQVEPSRRKLILAGEFDLMSVCDLEGALHGVIRTGRIAEIEVDLKRTRFIDATTVRTLVNAVRAARAADIACHVSNPRGLVRRVLEVTGVLHYLSPPACDEPMRAAVLHERVHG